MTDCLIALGSNQGKPAQHLVFAFRELGLLARTRVMRHSSLYRSAPLGPPQPEFLNAALWLRTGLSPMGLLAELKRLEAAHGRRPGRRWGPRPLDCDILFYGRARLKLPFLAVPHPGALLRPFALLPAAEIRPEWIPPALPRRPLKAWAARLKGGGQNVKVEVWLPWRKSPSPR